MKSVLKVAILFSLVGLVNCTAKPVAENKTEPRTPAQVGSGGGSGDIDSSTVEPGKLMVGSLANNPKNVRIGRITKVANLVNPESPFSGLSVSIAVEDLGGSSDVSPTQKLFLNIYKKGDWYSRDLSFYVGSVIEFKSAQRVAPGVYEVQARTYGSNGSMSVSKVRIDARKALSDLDADAKKCGDNYECSERMLETAVTSTVK